MRIPTLALLASWVSFSSAVSTLLPPTTFNSQAELEAAWVYNYPWGSTDHNGAARMDKSQVRVDNNTLTITAKRVNGQKPARHNNKDIPIKYLSGAIGARKHFSVARGGGLDVAGEFRAPVGRGTWPAFWLTYVDGWPPEIDLAEWKGSGKISFNTFNTSSQVTALDVAYPRPNDFHSIRCELRDTGNGRDVGIRFFMDGTLVTRQVGREYIGKAMYLVINLQMEGSSGSPGPEANTEYSARNVSVLSYP